MFYLAIEAYTCTGSKGCANIESLVMLCGWNVLADSYVAQWRIVLYESNTTPKISPNDEVDYFAYFPVT